MDGIMFRSGFICLAGGFIGLGMVHCMAWRIKWIQMHIWGCMDRQQFDIVAEWFGDLVYE